MIEIRTLGRTSVAVNREPLTGEAVWPKSLALIVYMAREPGPDRREEILGVLWPDRDEKRARRALNQLLYTLRKASPELDLESVSDALDFGREVWLDVEEFERRLDVGDLKGAVDLYGGPFLQDLSVGEPEFDHWADRQRADLRRKFRKAALQLSNQAKEAGDLDDATAYCRRLVEADALDDEAQHLLIECLHLRGDRLAALRQFERYREVLQRELEVEPLDHTRELVAQIKAERAPAEAAPEAGPPPTDEPPEERRTEGAAEAPETRPRPEPKTEVKSPGLPSVRWVPVALGVVTILAIASVWLWPQNTAERAAPLTVGELGAGDVRIAVLPFRPHGMGPDDLGLSDGIAQLLSLNISERMALETVDYRLVEQRWEAGGLNRAAALSAGLMSQFAADIGASALLFGDVHASGDELRLVGDLLDARSDARLAHTDVRGHRDSLFVLLDLLATSLVDELRAATDTAGSS
ncbi:MAG: BTAD domain-containing putative transcriptional regulator [Gemmatimonadales bacterium]|jgi:DNA-binding SARP family transcriptional activator/TolB-like protein